ncbi:MULTISPECIES: hypothetical protein [unclassified Micromonospora]|uniref:hypothetical protein n=1 Tax=unclassified Micromonospora TaxID=2617518 RepID=UPI003317C0DE
MMARIQILQLPPYGPDGEQPFALIVDQCEMAFPIRQLTGSDPSEAQPFEVRSSSLVAVPPVDVTEGESEQDRWQRFAEQIGARGAFVTPERVDIADEEPSDDMLIQFDHAALLDTVSTAVRAHLESTEASDAFRADMERRAAAARVDG